MTEEQKPHWTIRLLKAMVLSPINTAAILALLYFGSRAYIFNIDPMFNKLLMGCVAALWLILFLVRHLLKLIITIIIIFLIIYGVYYWSRRDIVACEDSGGTWNEQTQSCEIPQNWFDKLKKLWQDSIGK